MMYKIDILTLLSGIDIPIPELGVNIHQPIIKEIAYIGEGSFYSAAETLIIDKDKYILQQNVSEEDKNVLSNMSNFEVFLKLVKQKDSLIYINVSMLLTILFPAYNIQIEERFILLTKQGSSNVVIINENNFKILQEVVTTILCLHSSTSKDDFNPVGERARAIAEKIRKGREKAARLKGQNSKSNNLLSKYISGLGIGTNSLNIHNVFNLTIYQLLNQLERYSLYTAFNVANQAKMAGAKDVEDVDWLKDIEK